MRLKTLRIDDFGCFRNARLEDISDALVVVGGPQRAGKTTFMQTIRQLRSGVTRSSDIPPATDEYRIDAEILHEGHLYRYVLSGYAAPSISPIDGGPEVAVDDVFGPVTARQYRQLFTISLDELRRLPPGIDDSHDLAEVLLGGAYGNIADVSEVQESFKNRAYDIGLTKGDPTAKMTDLNDPYKTIREGLQARREANEQVDNYNEITTQLEETRAEQTETKNRLEDRQRNRDRLTVLKEVFEPVQRIDALEAELANANTTAAKEFPTHLTDRLEHFKSEFDDAVDELKDAKRTFERNAQLATTDVYREWLLTNEDQLIRLEDERKLWANRASDLTEQERQLADRRTELEKEIASLHPEWNESFTHVREIATNSVDTARVEDLVSTVSELRDEYNSLEKQIDTKRSRRDELQSQLSEMESANEEKTDVTVPRRKPMVVAATAVAVGTGAGIVISPVGGSIVAIVLLAIGMYAIDSTITVEPAIDTTPRQQLNGQISTLESEISANKDRREILSEKLATKEQELTELTRELGLPDDLPSGTVADFYQHIIDLDKKIDAYNHEYAEWDENREELIAELEAVTTLLDDVSTASWTEEILLENAPSLLTTLETAADDLTLATDVRDATQTREDCIEDIDSVLSVWNDEKSIDHSTNDETIRQRMQAFHDQAQTANEVREAVEERDQHHTQVTVRLDNPSAQEAFASFRDADEDWLDVVQTAAEDFADRDAIENELRDIQTEIEQLQERRDELHETCLTLEKQRDELASEDDLQEAQAQIDEGRVEFERAGEAYAVNRIAEKMVSQLHERLMEDVVHSLIDDASTIFSRITQEYDGIELSGELQDLEFCAQRTDSPDHELGELSRATAEQLFLAVRLARIRQTEAELPVVFDDAATNFDPNHVSRVFEVVGELSTTNQVFFLTSHPEIVNLTAASSSSAQYWALNDSAFMKPDDASGLEQRLMTD
jgi:uncharacterized protein YhaN